MKTAITDTPIHIQNMLVEGYRHMSPIKKLQLVDSLTITVQQLALARINRQYPEASEREKQLRLGSLWLGHETMTRIFHWNPQEKGY